MHIGVALEFAGYPNLRVLKLEDSPLIPQALIFTKDSEFLPIFNHMQQRMRESGILNNALNTINSRGPRDTYSAGADGAQAFAIRYENVFFPFVVLLFGVVISMGILIFESMQACKRAASVSAESSDS